ncbi:hypothetical protein [Parachlamydia acanthamoebae]|uniref:hypothetical protein n=1 Tax=Parachlamydia acanthamoebae TaxID=83552 RepID=UPI0001C179B2|nr:hypothetical protein [Parachlamydia acanthamoebae]EFB40256.1 hypothetical protein pah_c221o055 [Parachlamydia acanthamoebae str. Hall's coccus]
MNKDFRLLFFCILWILFFNNQAMGQTDEKENLKTTCKKEEKEKTDEKAETKEVTNPCEKNRKRKKRTAKRLKKNPQKLEISLYLLPNNLLHCLDLEEIFLIKMKCSSISLQIILAERKELTQT